MEIKGTSNAINRNPNAIASVLGNSSLGADVSSLDAKVEVLSNYYNSHVMQDDAISISNDTATDITSITLPPGDWDVMGNVCVSVVGTCTEMACWAMDAPAAIPDSSFTTNLQFADINFAGVPIPYVRFLLSETTTIYLSCLAVFSGTCLAYGGISARARPT